MLVVLHTKSRHGRAQRIQLRAHQVASFGRSEWADYSFSNDLVMADMHFEVRCVAEGCRLENLSEEAITKVNGQEVKGHTFLHDGDELQAGTTVLAVSIEGGTQEPAEEPTAEEETDADRTARRGSDWCSYRHAIASGDLLVLRTFRRSAGVGPNDRGCQRVVRGPSRQGTVYRRTANSSLSYAKTGSRLVGMPLRQRRISR